MVNYSKVDIFKVAFAVAILNYDNCSCKLSSSTDFELTTLYSRSKGHNTMHNINFPCKANNTDISEKYYDFCGCKMYA
jgi:hypothetical protein